MHQVSWAVSAGSQAVAQAPTVKRSKLELNNRPTSSGKAARAGGKRCPRPRQGLGASLIPSSRAELRALPARMCSRPGRFQRQGERMLSLTSGNQEAPCFQILLTFQPPPSSPDQALDNPQ